MVRKMECTPCYVYDGGQLMKNDKYEVIVEGIAYETRFGDLLIFSDLPSSLCDRAKLATAMGFEIRERDVTGHPAEFIQWRIKDIVKVDDKLILRTYIGEHTRAPLRYVLFGNVILFFAWEEIHPGQFVVSFEGGAEFD